MTRQPRHHPAPRSGVSTAITRRGMMTSGGLALGATVALAACGSPPGATTAPAGGAAAGDVSVLYYTPTEPMITRVQRQEAVISKALPSVKLSMIPTPDINAKFITMSAGGTPPDLTWAGIEVVQHAAGGLLTSCGGAGSPTSIHWTTSSRAIAAFP